MSLNECNSRFPKHCFFPQIGYLMMIRFFSNRIFFSNSCIQVIMPRFLSPFASLTENFSLPRKLQHKERSMPQIVTNLIWFCPRTKCLHLTNAVFLKLYKFLHTIFPYKKSKIFGGKSKMEEVKMLLHWNCKIVHYLLL